MCAKLPNIENRVELERWLREDYYAQLTGFLSTSLEYLHNTVNWGVVTTIGIVAAIFVREQFPDLLSWALLWFALPITLHFGVRTAKAYINVMRWSSIQRHVQIHIMNNPPDECDFLRVIEIIEKYHTHWVSPLARIDVIYKTLLEMGYGYFLFFHSALLIYVGTKIEITGPTFVIATLGFLFVILEAFLFLFKSPYLASISVDPETHRLR
ncbi:MAG: hypothetical protein MUO72_11745 [Bacteroidales bacterium]|nr:hypothetical protein [Bacteroidales bacterium]